MVFVILGTQDKEFPRLLEAVEREMENKTIQGEVVVQAGQTKFSSKKMKIFDFIPRDQMQEYIKKSDYIITHGGVGTIVESLNAHKKVIAVPRFSKYKEHENDHQLDIIQEFSKRGYILDCLDLDQLGTVVSSLSSFEPTRYQSNQQKFVQLIRSEIEK